MVKRKGCPPGQKKQDEKCVYIDPVSKNFDKRLKNRLAHLHITQITRDIVLPSIDQVIDDYDDYIAMLESDKDTHPGDPDLLKHKRHMETWEYIQTTIRKMR